MDAGGFTLTPIAASASNWQWQGSQRAIRRSNGTTCSARIALAVADGAACFDDVRDRLVCAGDVASHGYAFGSTPLGVEHVDQISLSWRSTSVSICVHVASGEIECMGETTFNHWGQYGVGTTDTALTHFTAWGGRSDLVAFGTGTWDSLCALSSSGTVYCAGYTFGATPVQYGSPGGHEKFSVTDLSASPTLDDDSVFRVSDGRATCSVTAKALECPENVYGRPGEVVMGGSIGLPPASTTHSSPACWLETSGHVYCAIQPFAHDAQTVLSVFDDRTALDLGTNAYTNTICAVFADGSVACAAVDVNLGTAVLGARAPANSAMIGCGTLDPPYPDITTVGVKVRPVSPSRLDAG